MDKEKLSHLDSGGRARMVDVSDKPESLRRAVAKGAVLFSLETLQAAKAGDLKKGDLRAVAELAGVMAAKKTADLIPLCHPLPLDQIDVQVTFLDEPPSAQIEAVVRTRSRTGVEMEALTAVSVAALAVYDMVKGIEKGAQISDIRLVEKSGGRSGDFTAE
jgi:cyclic pyranopterin phosphate synthase